MAKREEIRAMQDAWRAYLDLALGFTEASRKQATKVARRLLGKGGATADQLQSMAEDLVKTSVANRESLVRLVRYELDRTLGRVGLATAEEVADLTSRVRDLEQRLREAEAAAAIASAASASAAAHADVIEEAVGIDGTAQPAIPATTMPAKKAAPAKAAPAKAAPAKAAPAKAAPVKKAVVKKAVAKKTTPAEAVAKNAVVKKAVPRKATGTPPEDEA
jgi:polyhydroxyalkanoate synthesis regulator phasin